MSAHICPAWCHKCPDMKGEVMPGCYGTAVSAHSPYDMSRCTCQRPSREDRLVALEKEVKRLRNMLEASSV